jgi:choline dehydrogenase
VRPFRRRRDPDCLVAAKWTFRHPPDDPVAGLIGAEEFPGPAVTAGAGTVQYSRQSGTGLYHAVGSAAMGSRDDDVTDARLRVRGVTGLRIADASVLPGRVSGNTAAPAMLIGYRAADFILDDC